MPIAHEDAFADHLNIAGEKIDLPTLDDFLALEERLSTGTLVPFCVGRHSDRDANIDFEWSGGAFAITGAEHSKERGNFGFCYLDPVKSDKPVCIGSGDFPEYCTTTDTRLIIAIARTYFASGEFIDQSVGMWLAVDFCENWTAFHRRRRFLQTGRKHRLWSFFRPRMVRGWSTAKVDRPPSVFTKVNALAGWPQQTGRV